jgi:hypothetical protein
MLQPGRRVVYLGVVFCSFPVPHLRVPGAKVQRLREQLRPILRRANANPDQPVVVGGRTLASLLGFLQSFRLSIPIVALFSRELYGVLGQLPLSEEGYLQFHEQVALSPAALAECRFWYQHLRAWNGAELPQVAVSRVLYTDASGQGFGGLVRRVLDRREEPAAMLQAGAWEAVMSREFGVYGDHGFVVGVGGGWWGVAGTVGAASHGQCLYLPGVGAGGFCH